VDDQRGEAGPARGHGMRETTDEIFSRSQWLDRAGTWMAGGAVAVAAVAYAWLVDQATHFMHAGLALSPWLPLAVTPVAFMILAAVTQRYFPAAAGSGIPNAMAALQTNSVATLDRLFNLKMILARIVLSATAILFGASVGREGPTVHVGAAIAYRFGRLIPHRAGRLHRRALILAGGAAGIAAAFNTPLAGIVFAIEELARSYETRASGTTLVAVLIAGIVSLAMVGDYTYFGHPALSVAPRELLLPAVAVGLAGGLLGGSFSRGLLSLSADEGGFGRWRRARPLVFAFTCGLVLAIAGVLSGGSAFGTGYEPARAILEGGTTSLAFVPAKFVATLASMLAGIPGGLFAPSLAVGAGLGQLAGNLPWLTDVPGLAVLGTCAYLTGATQAPMTAFIIVIEMTDLHEFVLPLMVAALVSASASRLISGSLYHALAERLVDGDASAAHLPAQAKAASAG
jgi:H+/Cl- antiporter ClcA